MRFPLRVSHPTGSSKKTSCSFLNEWGSSPGKPETLLFDMRSTELKFPAIPNRAGLLILLFSRKMKDWLWNCAFVSPWYSLYWKSGTTSLQQPFQFSFVFKEIFLFYLNFLWPFFSKHPSLTRLITAGLWCIWLHGQC